MARKHTTNASNPAAPASSPEPHATLPESPVATLPDDDDAGLQGGVETGGAVAADDESVDAPPPLTDATPEESPVIGRIGESASPAPEDAGVDTDAARLAEIEAHLKAMPADPIAWRDEPLRMRESLEKIFAEQKKDFDEACAKLTEENRKRFAECQRILADAPKLRKEKAAIERRLAAKQSGPARLMEMAGT